MAYSARFHQNRWTYDPHGNDFDARVGRLLAGGQDLQASMREKSLKVLRGNLKFEKDEASAPGSTNGDTAFLINQTSTSSTKREPDTTGYVWVDGKGQCLGELPQTTTQLSSKDSGQTLSRSQALYTNMTPVQRSMHMWRRVNAGCVEATTRWKEPTYSEHFRDIAQQQTAEPVDKTHHLKKTDFSHYTEQKVKQGNMVDR